MLGIKIVRHLFICSLLTSNMVVKVKLISEVVGQGMAKKWAPGGETFSGKLG